MNKIFLLLLFLNSFAYSQTWEKTFPDAEVGVCVNQTNDNGYIVLGSYYDSGLVTYLLKTDNSGNKEWSQSFFGSSTGWGNLMSLYPRSVHQTSDGGFIICCYSSGTGSQSGTTILIKTDLNGLIEWEQEFNNNPGNTSFNTTASYAQQTSDGGYIIVGYSNSSNNTFLIKTNSFGIEQWVQHYTNHIYPTFVEQTNDGGFIISGRDFTNDYFSLLKSDVNGIQQWQKNYNYGSNSITTSCQQTNDGGYVLTGYNGASNTNPYGDDLYLIKTDNNGNEQWANTFGLSQKKDQGFSVQQTNDGGYIITGLKDEDVNTEPKLYLLKTDNNGNEQWSKSFGQYNTIIMDTIGEGYSVRQTNDGGYIVAGETINALYLLKVDNNGNLTSVFNYTNINENVKLDYLLDFSGKIINRPVMIPFIEIYRSGKSKKKFILKQ